MSSNQKSLFYTEIIKKSHDAFREFLTHLPEDILTWKIHESLYKVDWIIQHVIHDQVWIINVILDNKEEGHHFEEKEEGLSLEDMIEAYDDMVMNVESKLDNLQDKQLSEPRSYKNYSLTVEDWLFEYIHHLNHHGGEIGLILAGWKRKQRSLKD